MRPADLLQTPLGGVQLIEASAGTGKTYAICTLLVRLLLHRRLRLSEVLVVTFTNAATAELRERIQSRLQDALRAFEGGRGVDPQDPLTELAKCSRDPQEDRRRILGALATLDEASVFTIHGLCQRILQQFAFESGAAFDLDLAVDPEELLLEVVQDVWSTIVHEANEVQARFLDRRRLGLAQLLAASRVVVAAHAPTLVPRTVPQGDLGAAIREYAHARQCAKDEWALDRSAIMAALLGTPALQRRTYRADRIDSWVAELLAALGAQGDSLDGWSRGCARLSASELAGATRRGHSAPHHRFFELVETMRQAHDEAERALQSWWIASLHRALDEVRRRFLARKESLGVQTYDDLLVGVVKALRDDRGHALAAALRAHWPVGLIDEFQDTDPVQYEILRRIYRDPQGSMLMIGDPKQAIYAFRGADIFAYLQAARDTASARWTLGTNYRSDPGLIRAVNKLFGERSRPFLFEQIEHVAVEPRPEARERLIVPGDSASMAVLFVASEGRAGQQGRIPRGNWARPELPKVVAAEVTAALASGATLEDRPLTAGDFAVLTRTNEQAYDVQHALRNAGIHSVLYGDRSVLDSDEAREIGLVLQALAEPTDTALLRAALATTVFGFDAEALVALGGDGAAWDEWLSRFSAWHRSASSGGMARTLREVFRVADGLSRGLGLPGGERRVTNLLHLAEILQTASQNRRYGIAALSRWFDRVRHDRRARRQLGEQTEQLRLESDGDAVRITTIHRSKGLEFPWVICPYLWDAAGRSITDGPLLYHDPTDGHRLKLDLRADTAPTSAADLVQREALAEGLRLLYVAVTRAKHRLTLVWGRFTGWESAGLAYLWHAERLGRAREVSDGELLADLRRFARDAAGCVRIVELGSTEPRCAPRIARTPPVIAARHFRRRLVPAWAISSFSALTASDPQAALAAGGDRELDEARDLPPCFEPAPAVRWPVSEGFAQLEPGVQTGNLLHAVLEQLDFRRSQRQRLGDIVARELERYRLADKVDAAALSGSLEGVLDAPLLEGAALTLSSLDTRRRVSEMEFALPVSVPDGSAVTPQRLGEVFRRTPSPTVPSDYPARVSRLRFEPVVGFLRGYIDLVFEFQGRWYLVDYKSNSLGPGVEHYARQSLAAVMTEHHYYLQYHLYAVAVHRMLCLRVSDYDYDRDFGGVFYLFLRGITPQHSPGHGVFFDRPPRSTLLALAALLGPPSEGDS